MIGSAEQYKQAIEETKTTLKHINTIIDAENSREGRELLQTLIMHLATLEAEKAVWNYRTEERED